MRTTGRVLLGIVLAIAVSWPAVHASGDQAPLLLPAGVELADTELADVKGSNGVFYMALGWAFGKVLDWAADAIRDWLEQPARPGGRGGPGSSGGR